MKKRWFIVFAFALPAAILSYLYITDFFSSQEPANSPENENICKSLEYSPSSAVSIVFLSSKDQAKSYLDFISAIPPFDSNKINAYYIENYSPECEIYQEKALLCYSREIVQKSSSCPADFIVAIKENPAGIRSSSYMNVISINSNHPLTVFPHELAHALANLAEEYVPASLPRNSKNCLSSCEEFSLKDSCTMGCSKSELFRSIDSGIMRTLSSDKFGKFNEALIREKFQENTLTGKAILETPSCDEEYYLIEAEIQNNSLKILGQSIETGCLNQGGSGDFGLVGGSSDKFNPDKLFSDAPAEEQIDGEVFDYSGKFYLKAPITQTSLEIIRGEIRQERNLFPAESIACKK